MLTSIGLSTEYIGIEIVWGFIHGTLRRFKSFKRSQTFVTLIVWVITLIFNLIFFASGAGYYWIEMVDYYSAGINLVAYLFLQLIAFVYLLPLSDLEKKVNEYGEKFPKFYHYNILLNNIFCMYCLKYVCPAFALFLTATAVYDEFNNKHNYENVFEFILNLNIK